MTGETASGPAPAPLARSAAGFTLVELMIVVALIGLLAGLSAPFLIAAKASGNEAAAIGTLRSLVSAQAQYSNSCAPGFYTASLTTLVAREYISPDAGITPKSGFNFSLTPAAGAVAGPADCTAAPSRSGYYASAVPVSRPVSGSRGFATNTAGTIWQDTSGAAPTEPFQVAGSVSPIR